MAQSTAAGRREMANAIRALSMDAVQQASSGHPGMPMGMADIAQVLWCDYLRHNPLNPKWPDRDRFVVSNGHGSMLLYALLHLTGYDLPMSELRNFRQLGSRTPGHPEYGLTAGVETTTGPLGQGLANAVGMALGERALAARYNVGGHRVIDHYTWVFAGDGCLMEGISHEACSLAGTLGLGRLIVLYDDNGISIDGEVDGWFTDDTPARFEAYGWHVVADVDGHDAAAVAAAIEQARAQTARPSLICCRTVIGWGAPAKQGTAATHGAALGEDEVQATRERIGWHHPPFEIPEALYAAWSARDSGAALEADWHERMQAFHRDHPALASELERRLAGRLPESWGGHAAASMAAVADSGSDSATRKSSKAALDAFGPVLPELIGGSADLTESNLTLWNGARAITGEDASGNYVYFGVREFGMSAMLNGMALHGGFVPYGATFLTFSDYARNAVRMAALMGAGTVFVYTHDSIGLGEDGPTHQPVEHAASLRLIPGLSVWRPCDDVETMVAWRLAIERRDGPTALLLTRQGVPHQRRDAAQLEDVARGGYVLVHGADEPDVILVGIGSEVALAVEAAAALAADGTRARVVSMPCLDRFEAQDDAYRERVLPSAVSRRVVVEAGVTAFWRALAGPRGRVLGIDRFGESAPGGKVYEHFGLTAGAVAEAARELVASC